MFHATDTIPVFYGEWMVNARLLGTSVKYVTTCEGMAIYNPTYQFTNLHTTPTAFIARRSSSAQKTWPVLGLVASSVFSDVQLLQAAGGRREEASADIQSLPRIAGRCAHHVLVASRDYIIQNHSHFPHDCIKMFTNHHDPCYVNIAFTMTP